MGGFTERHDRMSPARAVSLRTFGSPVMCVSLTWAVTPGILWHSARPAVSPLRECHRSPGAALRARGAESSGHAHSGRGRLGIVGGMWHGTGAARQGPFRETARLHAMAHASELAVSKDERVVARRSRAITRSSRARSFSRYPDHEERA